MGLRYDDRLETPEKISQELFFPICFGFTSHAAAPKAVTRKSVLCQQVGDRVLSNSLGCAMLNGSLRHVLKRGVCFFVPSNA